MGEFDWVRWDWQKLLQGERIKVISFANGEVKPVIKDWEKIKNKKVWLTIDYYPDINWNLWLSLLVVDALKRIGIKKIRLEAVWFPYSPQDKVFVKGEPLSMELVVRLLEEAGVDEFVVWDVHKIESLRFFTKPVIHKSFIPYFAERLKHRVDKGWVVVSPDKGGKERAKDLAKILGVNWGYLEKERNRQSGKIKIGGLKRVKVSGKNVVLIDDFSAGGGTILLAAEKLKNKGARRVLACVGYRLMSVEKEKKLRNQKVVDEWWFGDQRLA